MCWRVQWSMWDRIQGVRNQELSTLWRSFIIQALFGFTLNTIPVLVSVLTFGVYVLLGNKLTASEAFTSLSLFTVRSSHMPSESHAGHICMCSQSEICCTPHAHPFAELVVGSLDLWNAWEHAQGMSPHA